MSFTQADSTTDRAILEQVVQLHLATLGDLFLSQLGSYFVDRYYDELRHDGGSLLGLWMDGPQVVGLAAGGLAPGQVFSRLGWRRLEFSLQMLRALARRPRLLGQLLASLGGVEDLPSSQVELTYFAVAPARQGQGLGKQLLEAYAQWWTARGMTGLSLSVEEENQGALRFYSRQGFQKLGAQKHGAYQRYLLRKPL
ncbi:MAG: GNAT family N-acetyltransferase [Vulcanimicrobiota bacterium]